MVRAPTQASSPRQDASLRALNTAIRAADATLSRMGSFDCSLDIALLLLNKSRDQLRRNLRGVLGVLGNGAQEAVFEDDAHQHGWNPQEQQSCDRPWAAKDQGEPAVREECAQVGRVADHGVRAASNKRQPWRSDAVAVGRAQVDDGQDAPERSEREQREA